MARSRQTKATATPATPATTSSRRTQASTPTNEDPPAHESRPPRTSKAAKSQAAEKAREIADELAFQARVEAAVRAVSTVAGAKEGIRVAKQAIRTLRDGKLGQNTEKSMGRATYELELYEQRHDELEAALPTSLTADDNHDHTSKGKAKAKAKATRTSNDARRTQTTQHDDDDDDDQPEEVDEQALRAEIEADVRSISTTAETSARHVQVTRVIQGLENEPLGRARDANLERARYEAAMLRQQHGELRAALPTAASSSNTNPGHVSKGKGKGKATAPPTQKTWTHVPSKPWLVRGIKNERGNRYLIAWRPTDGVHWDDSWERKDCADAKAVRDWNRRKRIEELREYVDGPSDVECV
jgi:hypothetical protein